MSSTRNNQERLDAQNVEASNQQLPPENENNETNAPQGLNFSVPTEFVDLPSNGVGYPEGHPLYEKDTIEIRFMTAKDEDILSSRTLLKKGLAVERFLDNILVDKNLKAADILVGDRNAILIAARISGYGSDYQTQVGCPSCGEKTHFTFDLNNRIVDESRINEKLNLSKTEDGDFTTIMPLSKFKLNFKLLNGADEAYLSQLTMKKSKSKDAEAMFSDQYKRMIVSIEGHTEKNVINHYVNNMPTLDSRHLRACYKEATPSVTVTENFLCSSCNHEEDMEVPFTADFFWPDR